VIVYTSPGCGPCHAAMDLLKKLAVPYEARDVTEPGVQEQMVELGSMSTPTIVVNGEVMVGFNPKALLKLLGK
jgi:glutaredoxin